MYVENFIETVKRIFREISKAALIIILFIGMTIAGQSTIIYTYLNQLFLEVDSVNEIRFLRVVDIIYVVVVVAVVPNRCDENCMTELSEKKTMSRLY